MHVSWIAQRYGAALAGICGRELADEQRVVSAAAPVLSLFDSGELTKVMCRRVFPLAVKHAVLERLVPENDSVRNMALLLCDRHQFSLFPQIIESYSRIVDDHHRRFRGVLWSSVAVSPKVLSFTAVRMEELTGRRVELENQTSTGLLGGVRVEIRSMVFDQSLASQLGALFADTVA